MFYSWHETIIILFFMISDVLNVPCIINFYNYLLNLMIALFFFLVSYNFYFLKRFWDKDHVDIFGFFVLLRYWYFNSSWHSSFQIEIIRNFLSINQYQKLNIKLLVNEVFSWSSSKDFIYYFLNIFTFSLF